MAKRKRTTRKSKAKAAPQHSLPVGFWSQVGAVLLIAISLLLVIAWFGAGGPILEWMHGVALAVVGYAVFITPLLFVYIAVETFRAEDNKLPFVMKFATALMIVWFAGLFGLMKDDAGDVLGGFVGQAVNSGMLALVDTGVAMFLYVLFIAITALFVLRVSPMTVIRSLGQALHRDLSEQDENVKVMRKAAATDVPKPAKIGELKLNAGVPTLDEEPMVEEKKPKGLSSLRGSIKQDKAAEEQAALISVSDPNWQAPSLELLEKKQSPADAGDVQQNAQIIRDTLGEFNIDVEMEGANIGPKVTQYTLKPPSGVKLTRITALETNIALNLAAQSLRIEAPIPGQRAVGIEVPNRKAADVRLYGILASKQWKNGREPLSFAIGKDISGDAVVGELNKMPHLLIAGQTGSGKSVMINTLLTSLLYRNSPSEMKLILVDPKQVEMAPYEDIPHLLTPVITEPEKTISALKWAVNEMERRYKLLAEEKIRDIKTYNQRMQSGRKSADGETPVEGEGAMPYIVIVIDELADLMMVAARDVEALIVRLAQKARAVGIHLVLATQRPSVDVITGLIKANVPARIAFTVASQIDSRTILDQVGAEKLLGQGDMLMLTPSMSKPKRIQGAWVMDEEVVKITDHLRMQSAPQYNDEIVSQPVQLNGKGGVVMDFDGGSGGDDMFKDAVRVVTESGKASTSLLQRRLRVGYARAARIIEEMEEQGIVGPADGARPREVLISSMDDLAP
ncbi:DNA translocase FtsK 4TM domain-containing protein [Streptomyces caniscabiei]|uniref:FtsK/SpoIIIE family DNA translocase n=1 Tax=Streptomyces caniscabiei TaxID=2746961 RepID=UPI0029B7A2C7|nr:DNA translocase FtsK 4TM domain-containing protein [Streptomyces caniscabiei]MDX2776320.1 DNA translocase FtsK 4TM domain-containing protein [Streptomyces caniscabiei]